MFLFVSKLAVVPLFIAAVSLAGRRWGTPVAGLFSGFPVVAGPIIVFIAMEQGLPFATQAAVAAILSLVCLIGFNLAYSWVCRRHPWPLALAVAVVVWLLVAQAMAWVPIRLPVALAVVLAVLWLVPRWFPPGAPARTPRGRVRDLPLRMATGAALTVLVTTVAAQLGSVWSGLFSAFPIIGLVLVVFTHYSLGAGQVAYLVRGNARGLYSFVAFFSTLVWVWPSGRLWLAVGLATLLAFAVQLPWQLLQWRRARSTPAPRQTPTE